MTTYTCPTCNQEVKRDMLILLQHTGSHIHETTKRNHPKWDNSNIIDSVSVLSPQYEVVKYQESEQTNARRVMEQA